MSHIPYRKLQAQEFRILLLNEDEGDGVSCELRTLNLDTHLAYVALSYTWGDRWDTSSLKLGGYRVQVQRNLATALQRLRHFGHRVVWADALCINQQDFSERAEQVSQMRTIYERAREVVIWLDAVSDRRSLPTPFVDLFCKIHSSTPSFIQFADAMMEDEDSSSLLEDLVKSTYWQRSWIMQEVAVASTVNLVMADYKIPWSNLSTLTKVMNFNKIKLRPGFLKLYRAMSTDIELEAGIDWLYTLDIIREQKGGSLLTMLNTSAGSKQREDVDVIFSKLGLAFDASQLVRYPDYAKTCRRVFVELAIDYIRVKKSLKIICSASLYNFTATDLGIVSLHLPSWIPDWRLPQGFFVLNTPSVSSPELVFRAAADTEAELRLLPHVEMETLVVRGFVYDLCCDDSVLKSNEQGLEAATAPSFYLSSEALLQSTAHFCRTVFANTLHTNDWSLSEALPLREVMLFQELLQQYYQNGALPERDHLSAQMTTQLLEVEGHELSYFLDTYKIFDTWAPLSMHGCCLRDWILECNLPDLSSLFESFEEKAESTDKLLNTLWYAFRTRKVVKGAHSDMFLNAPEEIEPGDKICILAGCDLPVVLRKHTGNRHTVIGCCYIDGIMHGEAMREFLASNSTMDEFYLI